MEHRDALLKEAYGCQECAVEGRSFVSEFIEARPGFFFKFPPLIGGIGKVKLLFVGYSPRRTKNNIAIHDFAMDTFENFCKLSENRGRRGHRYVGSPRSTADHEPHYDFHNDIVQRVFAKSFHKVAAVTEMYLCASEDGRKLNTQNSPCARRFLPRSINVADPDYIVTFGSGLPDFFRLFIRGVGAEVLHLPFPSRCTSHAIMNAAVDWAVASLIARELGQQPPQKLWKWPLNDAILPQSIMRYP
jgi:hypothetical protein